MTNINKNNYEEFFIDYFDGNLTAEKTAELFLFLESHPELKEEFNNFSNVQLDIPEMQFPDHNSLKKTEGSISGIDEKLIASLEGDLSFEEKKELESFIQSNPQVKKDLEIYKATVSVPDMSVVYPDKNSLKKPVPFYIAYRNEMRYGIAAILLLAFIAGMVSVFNRTMEQKSIQVAEESSVKTSVPPSQITDTNKSENTSSQTEKKKLADKENSSLPEKSADVNHKDIKAPVQKKGKEKQPLKDTAVEEETPVQMAVVAPAGQLPVTQENPQEETQPVVKSNQPVVTNSGEQYLTVWEALKQSSEKSLKKIVAKEEPVLAYADESADSKPTLADVVSKGLEKVSNDKVKLDTDKQNRHFSFSAGNFKIEKR